MGLKKHKQLITGIVIGTVIAGSGAALADSSVTATLTNVLFNFNGTSKALPDGYSTLNYQGHMYVPARFVAESMGGTVNWDASTNTVNINSQFNTGNSNDIATLKLYSKIDDQYKRLSDFGDALSSELYDGLNLAYDDKTINNSTDQLDRMSNAFDTINTEYTYLSNQVTPLTTEAIQSGADVTDMLTILHSYAASIAVFKSAYDDLKQSNYQSFISKVSSAATVKNEAEKISTDDYQQFYQKLQSYTTSP